MNGGVKLSNNNYDFETSLDMLRTLRLMSKYYPGGTAEFSREVERLTQLADKTGGLPSAVMTAVRISMASESDRPRLYREVADRIEGKG